MPLPAPHPLPLPPGALRAPGEDYLTEVVQPQSAQNQNLRFLLCLRWLGAWNALL
jgi:hypothetical protein